MEKKSKKELIEIIEEQENKIFNYRHKLRDVIEAYKGVTKEKEALEKSLKALNLSEEKNKEGNDKETSETETGSETQLSTEEGNSNDTLSTLKEAISTLTNEKIRIENCLTTDKKKLKQECETLQQEIGQLKEQHNAEIKKLNQKIQEHKWNLGVEQKQREEENKNNALMLRELQSLLTNERNSSDKLAKQVDKLRKQNENGCKHFEKQLEDYRKTVLELETQLNRMREKLASTENASLKPSPLLFELKKEMKDMKLDQQHAVVEEQRRANEAEEKLKSLARGSEERVTTLEMKVAELSEMIGNYDRLRQQDQQAIVKLKDRVAQLDLENMVLAQAANSDGILEFEASKLDPQLLIDKIIKLKNLLKIANERSEFPVDLSEVFSINNTLPESDLHSHCHEELEALRNEFEHYKARAQTVLKSKSVKDQDYSKENETLYNQISELKNKLQTLKSQSESGEEYRQQVINKLQNTLQDLKLKHRREISQIESNHASKLVELEQQMQKQRERTLALLQEKDKEIQNVKDSLLTHPLFQGSFQLQQDATESKNSDNSESEGENSKKETVAEMLSKTMASKKGEQKILHYVQEIARKDVEISNLRRGRHLLESTLRELQCVAATKEEKYVEEIELLSKKVSRLESSQNEKGVNMEYLKNVVLRFVLCKDLGGKMHMLNAIAAILHFTAKELEESKLNC